MTTTLKKVRDGLEILAGHDLTAAHMKCIADQLLSALDAAASDRENQVVQEMEQVAITHAHGLALDLECILADDYSGKWYDSALNRLAAYREAMNAIHERESPTFMGEPVITSITKEAEPKAAQAEVVPEVEAEPISMIREVADWISHTLPIPTSGATKNAMKLDRAIAMLSESKRRPCDIESAKSLIPLLQSFADRLRNDERSAQMFEGDWDVLQDAIALCRRIARSEVLASPSTAQHPSQAAEKEVEPRVNTGSNVGAWRVTGPYEDKPFRSKEAADAFCNGLNSGFGEEVYSVSPLHTHTAPVVPENWISVKDRLPEVKPGDYDYFLVACRRSHNGQIYVFQAAYLNQFVLCDRNNDDEERSFTGWHMEKEHADYDGFYEPVANGDDEVTHWMPLPSAPQIAAAQANGGQQ